MRFARLYLKAYGPFTDRVLDFAPRGSHDLHLLHGPNEAGKSSTLRAVTALLFGMPERTTDSFLHEYGELRVGACLALADGATLALMRRKARKLTLFPLDPATGAELTATPLPEDCLVRVLGGLDQALYQTLFGLDLDGLHAGSEALLRGEGEVGRSLFQAAAGLADLRALGESLEQAAADTYKARGSTAPLNRSLQDYGAQRQVLKELTVRSSAWESAERDQRRAQAAVDALRAALGASRAELKRLERLNANLPLLAEHAALDAECAQLAAVPDLAPEAQARRAAAEERLRDARTARLASERGLLELEAARAACIVRDPLLARASDIEQLYHALAAYRAARDALPGLGQQREQAERQLTALLRALDAVDHEPTALLPDDVRRAAVQAALEEDARLDEAERHQGGEQDSHRALAARLAAALAALPTTTPLPDLEDALARAGAIVERDAQARELARRAQTLEAWLTSEVAALWPGERAALLVLEVPMPATVSEFELAFAAVDREQRALAERESALGAELGARRVELDTLAASGEVVTQEDVTAARAARDTQWHRVREALDAPGQVPAALAGEFEARLREADRRADLLHADTARATRVADARLRIRALQSDAEGLAVRRATLLDESRALEARWQALVAPLRRPDLTPAALRDWLAARARIAERQAELAGLLLAREDAARDFELARAALAEALAACGLPRADSEESPAAALERARQAVTAVRAIAAERQRLAAQLADSEAALARLDAQRASHGAQRAAWRARWRTLMVALRLDEQARAAEVKVRLEQFARLAATLDERARLCAELETQARRVAAFEADVAALALAVEEAPAARAPDVLVDVLYAALDDARAAAARRARRGAEHAATLARRAEAEAVVGETEGLLAALCAQAGAGSIAELPALEQRAARKREVLARLADIERDLVTRNACALEVVQAEAAGHGLDEVAALIEISAAAIVRQEGELASAQETLFGASRALQDIDGGAAAAEAQQTLRSVAARIAQEARGYARLRLAHAVLARVVQRYREQHQGPLLTRAAALFHHVTRASFVDLAIDHDDDRQVLLGVREDGRRVPVTGMSQGTRDQLFFALRIAAIEQHIASRGPFPVIVDDLLVQFDDARALATLEVLAELATRTQVLFFTHHQHLVALAQASPLADALAVQRL